MRFYSLILMMGAFLALAACEPAGAPKPESHHIVYRGVIEKNAALKVFYPDTGDGPWAFDAKTSIWDTLHGQDYGQDAQRDTVLAEVELVGKLDTSAERYGHMGVYSGELFAKRLNAHRFISLEEAEALVNTYRENILSKTETGEEDIISASE